MIQTGNIIYIGDQNGKTGILIMLNIYTWLLIQVLPLVQLMYYHFRTA